MRCYTVIILIVFLGLWGGENVAFAQSPIPDIKVNSSDGPITLHQSDTLTITVALDNDKQIDNADWWLAADTPFGLYFFTFGGWTTDWQPGYQGPLFYLDSFEVLKNMPLSELPAGTYKIYFGVDIVMDGKVTWDSAYYDTIIVNIETPNQSHFPLGVDFLPMPLPEVSEEELEQMESSPGDEEVFYYNASKNIQGKIVSQKSQQINQEPKIFLQEKSSLTKNITLHSFSSLVKKNDPWLDWHYRPTVKLFIRFPSDPPNIRHVCSGSMIGPYHVLTAGHCVCDDGEWPEEVVAVPSYQNDYRPYGDALGVDYISWRGWVERERWPWDMAVIRLNRPVGALSEYYFLDHSDDCRHFYKGGDFYIPGYPADGPYDGKYMYSTSGNFDHCLLSRNMVRYNRHSYGGQSGSPVVSIADWSWRWVPFVYGVLSNGNGFTRCVVTEGKYGDIIDFIEESYPADIDLVALDVKVSPQILNPGEQLSSMSFVIHNYSQLDWSGSLTIKVYLSPNDFISEEDTLLSHVEFTEPISAFNSKTIEVPPESLPRIPTVPEGDYWIGVLLDVSDSNNNNNASHGQDASKIHIGPLLPPNPPSNLVITYTTPTNTVIRWQDNSYTEDGFKIERRPAGGSYTQIAITPPNQTEFYDFENPGGYCYRIKAYNLAGDSGYSNEECATIQNLPPIVEISQPETDAEFCYGQTIIFRGSASDQNEVFTGGLPDSAFEWRSDIDGFLGEGPEYTTNRLSVGRHTITLKVTDRQGLFSQDVILVNILSETDPRCSDLAPYARIVSPEDGAGFYSDGEDEKGEYATVTFEGIATDREDDDMTLCVEWYSDIDGFLGSGRSITAKLHAPIGAATTAHKITLRVTDSAGNVTEDTIQVYVEQLI